MKIKSSVISLLIISGLTILTTYVSPPESSLGTNARIVYLHGAWVWASIAAFIAAGGIGLAGLIFHLRSKRKPDYHQWSRAWGRAGLIMWITYLPVSLWAMQTNWNGLFLSEPRWRIAVIFAITGILLQLGLSFTPLSWSSFWNFAFILSLFISLQTTEKVLHPPSPMLDSNAWRIQVFYGGLVILLTMATWQLARIFHHLEPEKSPQ